jgi:FMN-dependent dehydrogenase
VSNHGGRQLDCAAAPLDVLPEILDQAGDMTVMIDGGIRRGTDVLKALALGARFVFVGRPFLFAAVTGGEAGVRRAIALLVEEVDRDMGLLGITSLAERAAMRCEPWFDVRFAAFTVQNTGIWQGWPVVVAGVPFGEAGTTNNLLVVQIG